MAGDDGKSARQGRLGNGKRARFRRSALTYSRLPFLMPSSTRDASLRMFQYQTISFTGLQSVLLRHRGDDTVHPQVLYKLPVVVCDVPNGND